MYLNLQCILIYWSGKVVSVLYFLYMKRRNSLKYAAKVSVKMFKSNTLLPYLVETAHKSEYAPPCLDANCSLEATCMGAMTASSGLWLPSAQSKVSAVEFNKAISQSGELEAKAVAVSQRTLYVAEGWGDAAGTQRRAKKHLPSVSTSAVSH